MYDDYWKSYLTIGVLAIIYSAAAFYFYTQRNKISFLTRSPLCVTLSLFMLGTDSILNTLIFSGAYLGESIFHWQCDVGIVCATLGQFGFMLATGIRIYRISKVYNTYLSYLEVQKKELTKPADRTSQILTTSPNTTD